MKNHKGITLIALVVTIVVLLMLAGVSITMLRGDNGIVTQAQKAKEETKIGELEETVNLWRQERMVAKNTGGTQKSMEEILEELVERGTLTDEEAEKIINDKNNEIKIGDRTISFKAEVEVVEPENIDDWKYTEEDDGTITINGYKGRDTTVIIPNYINGKPIKKLESGVFANDYLGHLYSIWSEDICSDKKFYWYPQKTIKEVIISEGIETIGKNTFMFSEAIEKVTIPNSIKKIDDYAFGNCDKLTEVTYLGTKENWNKIEINYANDQLKNAKITYKN